MKKFLLFTFFVFIYLFSVGQTFFRATTTEMYTINKNTEEWSLYEKNSNTDIVVVMEHEFITFQARTPTMYKIYLNTKESVSSKSLKGYRYSAKDLKEDVIVIIDILKSTESPIVLISIVNSSEGYNLRFFLSEVIE
jgi:hypothetical protein